MNIEEFREYCLSLGEVTEKMPFGKFARRFDSLLVFYVLDHMFCFVDIEDFTYVNVKSSPEEIARMKSLYASLGVPGNSALKYWLRLDLDGDIPETVVRDAVAMAYRLVKEKYMGKSSARRTRKAKKSNGFPYLVHNEACSQSRLTARFVSWSGKRGSNSRPSAWEELSCYAFTPLRGVKQPTELLPLISDIIRINAI